MSLRNTFNTIQIDCRYPIHYIFRETRKEFFNFSLKNILTHQNKRKNDQIQIACSKGGGGRVLQLHGPRLWWQLVFRGIFFTVFFRFNIGNFGVSCSRFFLFFNIFWQLVFRGIFYLHLLFFNLFFSFSYLLRYFVAFGIETLFFIWINQCQTNSWSCNHLLNIYNMIM